MASEKAGAPPPYDASAPPEAPGPSAYPQYPPSTAPYPQQAAAPYPQQASAPYPTNAAPGYPAKDATQGYPPAQGAPPGYPAQGAPPGYPQGAHPGYPQGGAPQAYPYAGAPPGNHPQGAAAGYTTQGVPLHYNQTSTNQTTTVITQQPGGVAFVAHVAPQDHLALSIVSMFCCFFIGIFAVMNSIRSRDRFRVGDAAGALHYGLSAKRLATTAIVIAICVYITVVILRIALQAIFV